MTVCFMARHVTVDPYAERSIQQPVSAECTKETPPATPRVHREMPTRPWLVPRHLRNPSMMFNSVNAVQIAYHVPDPASAAREYAAAFGWGPFFLFEHIALSTCLYRGLPARFDHSSAYGQAGGMMVELITQHDDTPSVLRDLYAADAVGVHHVAHFVPNLSAALDQARAAGTSVSLDACTVTGTRFAMLDTTPQLGHMIELYEGAGDLLKFYRFVRRAADGWNGSEPLRRLVP